MATGEGRRVGGAKASASTTSKAPSWSRAGGTNHQGPTTHHPPMPTKPNLTPWPCWPVPSIHARRPMPQSPETAAATHRPPPTSQLSSPSHLPPSYPAALCHLTFRLIHPNNRPRLHAFSTTTPPILLFLVCFFVASFLGCHLDDSRNSYYVLLIILLPASPSFAPVARPRPLRTCAHPAPTTPTPTFAPPLRARRTSLLQLHLQPRW